MKRRSAATNSDVILKDGIYRLVTAMGRMPRPMARRLGDLIGRIAFRLDRRHRRIALDNLAYALGDDLDDRQRWQMAQSVFCNLAQILFEVGWSLAATPAELERCIRIDGLANYRAAFEKGRGVLAITAHLGNWELLPIVARQAQIPVSVVYRPLDFMPLELFFVHLRTRFGARLIPSSQAMLKIVRALRKKETVTILIDQSVDWYDGVWVDFFGRPTCTSVGAAMIALKTDAPVVPVFMYREPSGFRAVFDRAVPLVRTGDKTHDIQVNTLNYSRAIEAGIRRRAEQWFWVHRRWKNKPYSPWPRSTP